MREYFINFSTVSDKAALHKKISTCLSLPDYYGNNLDALYDCLSELRNCCVYLSGTKYLTVLGEYGRSTLQVFLDTAEGRSDFILIIEN